MFTNTNTLTKLERLLDLAKQKGASEAEVIQMTSTENPVNFENNKLKALESNESSGISLRVIKDKKIGISSSTNADALEEIVDSAVVASEYGQEALFKFSKENINCRGLINQTPTPLESLIKRGTDTIESLKPLHKDLLISGGFNLSRHETTYINSNGVHGRQTKTIYSTSFYANLVRGEDFLGIYEGNCSLSDFPDEKEISKTISKKFNFSSKNISLKTKKYPVIFTPAAVSSIFGYIFSVILNGKAVEQKVSPLFDKLGKKMFDKKLTLTEDPDIGINKAEFDDEGIKTKKKDLIKEGIVNSFYFDLNTACRDVARYISTGNGFKASLSSAPSPALTTLVIKNGNKNLPYQDMIKNIKEGIIVDQLLGAGQSNTLLGEFNVGIDLGFKIEEGEIQGRIKNCMVAGNIFDVLKNIQEISTEQEWVYGTGLYPYFLIDEMTVAGK